MKACALIGLHMVIEKNSGWSEKGSSVSSSSFEENNVGNDALSTTGPATQLPSSCETGRWQRWP